MWTIGYDNGISGAVAILNSDRRLVAMRTMPCVKARSGNEIQAPELWDWVAAHIPDDQPVLHVIEEPSGSRNAKAARSMAGSFHTLRTMLAMQQQPMERITPARWQRSMLPGCKAGDTKPRALELARRLFPEQTWLVSTRCKTPHDGLIDAALIAYWAAREL